MHRGGRAVYRIVFVSVLCVFRGHTSEGLTSEVNIGEYGHHGEQRQQNPAGETPDITTGGCKGG